MPDIYLDYNASARMRPEAREAIRQAIESETGNPSSIHRSGHRAKVILETARESVARLLGSSPQDIVFTSGGTEANNLAIQGAARNRESGHLVVSRLEHASVLEPAADLERRGFRVSRVSPDPEGRVEAASIQAALAPDTFLVSLMHSSNELGTLQPIDEITASLARRGVLVHCDAVQSAGKVPLDVRVLGVDLLSLSAHKLGGPPGVGCLWIRPEAELAPLIRGGGQESNRRAGTPAVALIAGFGAAAEAAGHDLADAAKRLGALRDDLEIALAARIPGIRFHGRARPRLPNTLNFAVPESRGEDLVIALDLEGIAVSTGSACAAGAVHPSHVLEAIGCPPAESLATLRVSLGWGSTRAETERFVDVLERLVAGRSPAHAGGRSSVSATPTLDRVKEPRS